MTEHYDRHRHDAEQLAEFAGGRGLHLSPERAYRAWIDHSESMAAGWIVHELEGDEADITFAILEGAEGRLQQQDRELLEENGPDVDRLHAWAVDRGLDLSREDVVRAWADHSATRGERWETPESGEADRVMDRYSESRPEGPSYRP